MSIIWCGGEDIDFPNGIYPGVDTGGGKFRSAWARCVTHCSYGPGGSRFLKSTTFSPITSGWLRGYVYLYDQNNPVFFLGLGKAGTNSTIGVGSTGNNSSSNWFSIVKVDSGSMTTLAASSVNFGATGLYKLDLNLVNYGASTTINLYVNGQFAVSWSGNATMSGVSSFDSVFTGSSVNGPVGVSEVIVADETTLALQGLVTLAPNGNGASQQWTNANYTNVNPAAIDDTNATYTNTVGQDEQLTTNNFPSGNFQVEAVKVIARAMKTAGATPTNLKVGFNNTNNGTVAEGAVHAVADSFAPVEEFFTTDPTNGGADWGSNLNGYQIELRSA